MRAIDLRRDRPGQHVHRAFGHAVGAGAGNRVHVGQRPDHDDPPAIAGQHARQHRTAEIGDTDDIDADRLVPLRRRLVEKVRSRVNRSGADHHVDRTMIGLDRRDPGGCCSIVADIERLRMKPPGRTQRGGFVQRGLPRAAPNTS